MAVGQGKTNPRRSQQAPPAPEPSAGQELVAKAGGTLTKFIEAYSGDFARVMPKHVSPEAFIGLAGAYVRRDAKLRQAADVNPASLILALRECAALGHVPQQKIFALVPFNDKNAPGGKTVVGIETYHGVIERMYRAGAVQAVKCELVRKHDLFDWDPMRQAVIRHSYDPHASEEDRGPLAGTYAWAVMTSGINSQVVWLNRHEVMKHQAVARTDAFWDGPWEPDMWRKTGLHVLERYVPTSAEYRWQVAASEAAASTGFAGVPRGHAPSPDDTVYDAELVDDDPQPNGASGGEEHGVGWRQTRNRG